MRHYNLEYTPIKNSTKPIYKVDVSFEHGDADATTTETYLFTTEQDILYLIDSYKVIEEELSECCGNPSSTVLEKLEKLPYSVDYLLVRDIIYRSGDNYASPWIKRITYIDSEGSKFNVKINEGLL